jgi:cysteine desulfurase/selenocysteine lyase
MPSLIENSKGQFPAFNGPLKDWSYLDSAATTQKPMSVIQAVSNFYINENANIHRGLYDLSAQTTRHYEEVRRKVKNFIGASGDYEIAFTSGTTESINIVSHSVAETVNEGDEILISAMEHHSNLIPWQQVCLQKKAILKIIPVDSSGDLELTSLNPLLTAKTKLVALTHISNTLGTINPIGEIIERCHKKNIPVLIDAAQSVSHIPINVSEMNVDFLAFSAHKMFGPMGTGVLFVKKNYRELIKPISFGGGAIKQVTFNETKFREFPFSVEAGTPNIAGVMGLGAAIDFLKDMNGDDWRDQSQQLASLLRDKLKSHSFVSVVGNPKKYSGIVTFVVDGIHAHDVAGYLSDKKIAVRAGHHCTQPLHEQLGLTATVRASFSIYNSVEDVERLVSALIDMKKFWS